MVSNVEVQIDAKTRRVALSCKREFDVTPYVLTLGFSDVKAMAAEVLALEVAAELALAAPQRPQLVRGV